MKKGEQANRSRSLWLWVLLAYTGVIFFNSLMPAKISSQESGTLLETFQGFLEAVGNDGAWLTEHIIRKAAHFIEYAGLGCVICAYCGIWRGEEAKSLRAVVELVFIIPFLDETIQLFVPGRSGQMSDVWLDISGAVIGFIGASASAAWRNRKRRAGI